MYTWTNNRGWQIGTFHLIELYTPLQSSDWILCSTTVTVAPWNYVISAWKWHKFMCWNFWCLYAHALLEGWPIARFFTEEMERKVSWAPVSCASFDHNCVWITKQVSPLLEEITMQNPCNVVLVWPQLRQSQNKYPQHAVITESSCRYSPKREKERWGKRERKRKSVE